MVLAEVVVYMFTGIEKSFVLAIDKQVCHCTDAGDIAHILVQASLQFVLYERIGPVVMASTQNDSLEFLDFERKQRIIKPIVTVSAAEIKPETVFAITTPHSIAACIARAHIVASVHAQAAVSYALAWPGVLRNAAWCHIATAQI